MLAGLAAALVAVHPLNVEAVAAINYREDLLAACFLLLGLLAVAAARRAPNRAAGGAGARGGVACGHAGLFLEGERVPGPASSRAG